MTAAGGQAVANVLHTRWMERLFRSLDVTDDGFLDRQRFDD